MKSFLIIAILTFGLSSIADSDIIAIVNNNAITQYDFESRKKVLLALGMNKDKVNNQSSINPELKQYILNELINDLLLKEYAQSTGHRINKADIKRSISRIEKVNKMQKDGMRDLLDLHSADYESFERYIELQLIKQSITSKFGRSIKISSDEVNFHLSRSGRDSHVKAWIFSSNLDGYNNLRTKLQNEVTDCSRANKELYSSYDNAYFIDKNISDVESQHTQSALLDTKIMNTSTIYKDNNKFKFVLICDKTINSTEQDFTKFKYFMLNKKIYTEFTKFINGLRQRAYIKILD